MKITKDAAPPLSLTKLATRRIEGRRNRPATRFTALAAELPTDGKEEERGQCRGEEELGSYLSSFWKPATDSVVIRLWPKNAAPNIFCFTPGGTRRLDGIASRFISILP